MTLMALEEHLRPLRPSPFERMMSQEELTDLDVVLDAALDVVRNETGAAREHVQDFATATEALHRAWAIVYHALKAGPVDADRDVADLLSLVDRLHGLDVVVRDAEVRRRSEMTQAVGASLSRLQSAESLPHLIRMVPEVVCTLGFDRAIMSTIVDAQWVTQSSHVVGDDEWAAIITQVGQETPAALRGAGIPESEAVRRRAPALVLDVQGAARVHRPMAEASLSRSYVVAPVVLQSKVIGLVHGDRVFHRGDIDSFDQDTLALFADGLSLAFERTAMQTRLHSIRASLRQLVGDTGSPDEISFASPDPLGFAAVPQGPALVPTHSGPRTSVDVLFEQLTRRELQIVRHLANGETNSQIASRLVLAEDTVKTHVKHILRKLGASNRAEAVSKWLLANSGHR